MAKFTVQELSDAFAEKKLEFNKILNQLKNEYENITPNEELKIRDFLKYLLLYGNISNSNKNKSTDDSENLRVINELFINAIEEIYLLPNKKIIVDMFTDIIKNEEWLPIETIEQFTNKKSPELIDNNQFTITVISAALENFDIINKYIKSQIILFDLINAFSNNTEIVISLLKKIDLNNVETIIKLLKDTIKNKSFSDNEQIYPLIEAYTNKVDIKDFLIFVTELRADLNISSDILERLLIEKFKEEKIIQNLCSTQHGILLLLDIMNKSNNSILKSQIETILYKNIVSIMANLEDEVFKSQAETLSELIEINLLKNLINYSTNESHEILSNIFQDNLLLKTISSNIDNNVKVKYYEDMCSHVEYILNTYNFKNNKNINAIPIIKSINESIISNKSHSYIIQTLTSYIAMILTDSLDINDQNKNIESTDNANLLNELYKHRNNELAIYIKNHIENKLIDNKSIISFYKSIQLPGQIFIDFLKKADLNNLEQLTDIIEIYNKSNAIFDADDFKEIFNIYHDFTQHHIIRKEDYNTKLLKYNQLKKQLIINLLENDNPILSDQMIEYILKIDFSNEIQKNLQNKKITAQNYTLFLQQIINYKTDDENLNYYKSLIIKSCFNDSDRALSILENLLSEDNSIAMYIANNFENYYSCFATKQNSFYEILGKFYKKNKNASISFDMHSILKNLDSNVQSRLFDKVKFISDLYEHGIIKLESNLISSPNQNPLNYFFSFKGYTTYTNPYAGLENILNAYKYKDQEPWSTYWSISANLENLEYFEKILYNPELISTTFYSKYMTYLKKIPEVINFIIYSKNFVTSLNIKDHIGKNDLVSKRIVKNFYLDNDYRDNLTHPKKLLRNLLFFNNVRDTEINKDVKAEIDNYINNKLKCYVEAQLVEIFCDRLKKEVGFDDKIDSIYTYMKSFLPSRKNQIQKSKNLEIKEKILEILNKKPQTLKQLHDLVGDNEQIKNIISNTKSWNEDLEIANFIDAMFSINENNVVDFFEKKEIEKKSNTNSAQKGKSIFFNKQFINNPPFNRSEHIKKCFGSNISIINNDVSNKLGLNLDNATKSLILKDITLGTSADNLNSIFNELTRDLNFYYENSSDENETIIKNEINNNTNLVENNLATNDKTPALNIAYEEYTNKLILNEEELKNTVLNKHLKNKDNKTYENHISTLNELSLEELISIITSEQSSIIHYDQNIEHSTSQIIKNLISKKLFENVDNLMSLSVVHLTNVLPLVENEVEKIILNQLFYSIFPKNDANEFSAKMYINNICKCSFLSAAISLLDTPYSAKFKSLHKIAEENLKEMDKTSLARMISDSKNDISTSIYENTIKNISVLTKNNQDTKWLTELNHINVLEFSSEYKYEQELKSAFNDREKISELLKFCANYYEDPTKHLSLLNTLESNIEDFELFIDTKYPLKYTINETILIKNLYSLYRNELSIEKTIKLFNKLLLNTNGNISYEFNQLCIAMAINIVTSNEFNPEQHNYIINIIADNFEHSYVVEILSDPKYFHDSKKIINMIFNSSENNNKKQVITDLFNKNFELLKSSCEDNEETKKLINDYIIKNFDFIISKNSINKKNLISFLKNNFTPEKINFKQIIGHTIHNEYGSKYNMLKFLHENNLLYIETTNLNTNNNPIILAAQTNDLQAIRFLYNKRNEDPWKEYWQLAGDAENTLVNCLDRNENNNNIIDIFNKLVKYIYTIPSVIENVIFKDIDAKDKKTTKLFAEMYLSEKNSFYSTKNIFTHLQKFKIEKLKNKKNSAMNAETSQAHRSDTYSFILNRIHSIGDYLQTLKQNYYPKMNQSTIKKQIAKDNRLIILKCFLENQPPIDDSGDYEVWKKLVELCGAQEYIKEFKNKGAIKFSDFKVFAKKNKNILDAINTPRFPGIMTKPPTVQESAISNLLITHIHNCDKHGRNKNQSFFAAWDVDITETWSSPNEYATGISHSELRDLKNVFECTNLLMRQEPEDIIEKLQSSNDIIAFIEKMEFTKALELKNKIIEAKKPFNKFEFEEELKLCIIEQQKILQMGFVEALTQIRLDNSCITGRITRLGMFVLRYTPYFSNHDYTDGIKVYFEDKLREFSDHEITKILTKQLTSILYEESKLSPSIKQAIKNIITQKPNSLDELSKFIENCDQKIAQDIKLILFPREGKKFNIQQNPLVANFLDAMFTINESTLPTLIAEGNIVTATSAKNGKNQKIVKINDFDKPPYDRAKLLRKCYGSNKQILHNAYASISFPKEQINRYTDSFCFKCVTSGPGKESVSKIFKEVNAKIDSLAMASNTEEIVFKIVSLANNIDSLMPKDLSPKKQTVEIEHNELNSSSSSSQQIHNVSDQIVNYRPSSYLRKFFNLSFSRTTKEDKNTSKMSASNISSVNENIKRDPAQAMLLTFIQSGEIATALVDQINKENKMLANNPYTLDLRTELKKMLDIILSTKRDSIKLIDPYQDKAINVVDNIYAIAKQVISSTTKEDLEKLQQIKGMPANIIALLKDPNKYLQRFEKIMEQYSYYVNFKESIRNMYNLVDEKQPNDEEAFRLFLNILQIKNNDKILTRNICKIAEANKEYINIEFLKSIRLNITSPNITFDNMMEIISNNTHDMYQTFLQDMNECIKRREAINSFVEIFSKENATDESIIDNFLNILKVNNQTVEINPTVLKDRITNIYESDKLRELFIKKLNSIESTEDFNKLLTELLLSNLNILIKDIHANAFAKTHFNDEDIDPIQNNITVLTSICVTILEISTKKTVGNQVIEQFNRAWYEILTNEDFKASNAPSNLELSNISNADALINSLYRKYLPVDFSASSASRDAPGASHSDDNSKSPPPSRKRKT